MAGTRISSDVPSAIAIVSSRPASSVPSAGMSTIRITTARSSTSVMPIMTRPWRECSSPRSMSRRASTIVLATEITMPTMAPCSSGQPRAAATPTPSTTDRRMPSGPPSSATHFTLRRSRSENSMPIENIRRMTPISANSSKVWRSETEGPGVRGLIRIPPTT